MAKLLAEVYFPYAERSFDLSLPDDMPLRRAAPLAAKALADLSEGLYLADDSATLYRRDDGAPLNIDMTAAELGLENGARLMLI